MARPRRVIVYRHGTSAKAAATRVLNAYLTSTYGTAVCPTCGNEIGKRIDGSLRNHRIGTSFADSMQCTPRRRTDLP